ncbi:MAG: NIPSNAP family protein [Alistipes sp.]|nr:NIPSNAP family protein [Alistipes sp.]
MKNLSILQVAALASTLLLTLGTLGTAKAQNPATAQNATKATTAPKQIYEWKIYTLAKETDAARLDAFFSDALIPAYARHGIDVGAFATADAYPEFPAGARYLFIAWPDMETYTRVSRSVRDDADFMRAAKSFFDASAPDPAYTNLETYLCEAFDGIPQLRRPDVKCELYEFRVYRSPNMEANERKIKMFESGEVQIFDESGIRSVCFGRTLAGPRMPSLTYLTAYENRTTRADAWSKFGSHPEWRRMSRLPEYAHTATDNTSRLLTPMPYSKY